VSCCASPVKALFTFFLPLLGASPENYPADFPLSLRFSHPIYRLTPDILPSPKTAMLTYCAYCSFVNFFFPPSIFSQVPTTLFRREGPSARCFFWFGFFSKRCHEDLMLVSSLLDSFFAVSPLDTVHVNFLCLGCKYRRVLFTCWCL